MTPPPDTQAEPIPPPSPSPCGDSFVAEVLRINLRYTVEVVEQWNFCPFARAARHAGEVVREVVLESDPERAIAPSIAAMERLTVGPGREKVEIALVIHPLLDLTPLGWDEWVQRLRAEVQARTRASGGQQPAFAAAAFHPHYGIDRRSPERLVPFFRRSPDPLVQWVRLSTLDSMRKGSRDTFLFDYSPEAFAELERRLSSRSITEKITDDNHATVEEHGPTVVERAYDDIARDRTRSYARFAHLYKIPNLRGGCPHHQGDQSDHAGTSGVADTAGASCPHGHRAP